MIRVTEIVTCLVGIVVFSLIAWLGFLRAVDSFQSSDVMAGASPGRCGLRSGWCRSEAA